MIHHHAAFSPKSSEGSFPPAKSSFRQKGLTRLNEKITSKNSPEKRG